MTNWITVFAVGCCTWCLFGLGLRWANLRAVRQERAIAASQSVISGPPPQSLRSAWAAIIGRPWLLFHRRVNRLWAVGYACYHAGILLVVAGYAASFSVIVARALRGQVIPNYFTQSLAISDTSVGNIALWVFGNAETDASEFLFGCCAPAFRGITWVELPLAVIGNACLLTVVLAARVGAIRRGIDAVTGHVRYAGCFSGQHLLVRLIILSIIALEFIGRFEGYKSAAVYHAMIAFSLIALVPVTYLTHIPLAPIALWQALARRRLNRVV